MTVFVFYAVAFDPIKIQACQTHQNDLLNLIFVKDIHVVFKKITRNGPKRVIFEVYYDFLRYRRYLDKMSSELITKACRTKQMSSDRRTLIGIPVGKAKRNKDLFIKIRTRTVVKSLLFLYEFFEQVSLQVHSIVSTNS